jgi:hypothetical protein
MKTKSVDLVPSWNPGTEKIPDVRALADNITYLASLASTPDERVGLLMFLGPRISRLFDECRIIDHDDAFAAVKAYADILPVLVEKLDGPHGPVLALAGRCQKISRL